MKNFHLFLLLFCCIAGNKGVSLELVNENNKKNISLLVAELKAELKSEKLTHEQFQEKFKEYIRLDSQKLMEEANAKRVISARNFCFKAAAVSFAVTGLMYLSLYYNWPCAIEGAREVEARNFEKHCWDNNISFVIGPHKAARAQKQTYIEKLQSWGFHPMERPASAYSMQGNNYIRHKYESSIHNPWWRQLSEYPWYTTRKGIAWFSTFVGVFSVAEGISLAVLEAPIDPNPVSYLRLIWSKLAPAPSGS